MPTILLALHIAFGILSLIVFPLTAMDGSFFGTGLLILGDFLICFLPYCCFIARSREALFPALLLYGFTGSFMSLLLGAQILIAVGFTWQILFAGVGGILVAVLLYLLIGFLACALFRWIFDHYGKR